jgi:hypothetical protein
VQVRALAPGGHVLAASAVARIPAAS